MKKTILTLFVFIYMLNDSSFADDFLNSYKTTTQPFKTCTNPETSAGCVLFDQRWDSSKRQFIKWSLNDKTADGHFQHTLQFRNREFLDGDTTCFGAQFLTNENKPVWVFKVRWGVDIRDNRQKSWDVELPKSTYDAITQVRAGYRACNKVNDREMWKRIINAASVACKTVAGDGNAAYCDTAASLSHRINH